MSHVIAAVSTGSQISAIGILRLTGTGCAQVAGKNDRRRAALKYRYWLSWTGANARRSWHASNGYLHDCNANLLISTEPF